ncbi:MAG: hypothetical protein Kow0042_26410 [Calditrichia bacterium]
MEKIKLYYHKETDSMDIWFDDPAEEISCEEVGEGIILKKIKMEKQLGLKNYI